MGGESTATQVKVKLGRQDVSISLGGGGNVTKAFSRSRTDDELLPLGVRCLQGDDGETQNMLQKLKYEEGCQARLEDAVAKRSGQEHKADGWA